MNYRKIFFAAFLFFICGSFLIAETAGNVWEGTAAMSRFGEFPLKGCYGASNSFPINTIISVQNIKNNKTVEVIISDTLNDNNLFLLLSKDAAEMLDIKQDEILSVKTQIINEAIVDKRFSGRPAGSAPESTILGDVAKIENILSAEEATADGTLVPSSEKLPHKVVIIYDDFNSVAEIPADVDEETDEEIEDAEPEYAVIADEETEEPDAPAFDSKDSAVIAESEPVDNDLLANAEVYYENGEKKYFLRPTDPKPPVVDETTLIPDKTAVVPVPERNSMISKDSYYVQIIAFKDYSSAENVMKSVKLDSPVIIHYDKKESLYKVMAGPLKTDERGVVLYKAKNSGYKDAFIRKGE